jgi:hypothetical protein
VFSGGEKPVKGEQDGFFIIYHKYMRHYHAPCEGTSSQEIPSSARVMEWKDLSPYGMQSQSANYPPLRFLGMIEVVSIQKQFFSPDPLLRFHM